MDEHERRFRSRLAAVLERNSEPASVGVYWDAVARAALDPFVVEVDAHVEECAARMALDGPLVWGALRERSMALSGALDARFDEYGRRALGCDDAGLLVDHVLGLDAARYDAAVASVEGARAIVKTPAFKAAAAMQISMSRVLWTAFERFPLAAVMQAVERGAVRSREPGAPLDFEEFAIVHPRYGIGVAQHDLAFDSEALECCFADAVRKLEGGEEYWEDARAVFRHAAAERLGREADASDERFWSVVAELGWSEQAPIEASGARLAARCSLEECVALHSALFRLEGALRDRVEAWERASGVTIEIGDDCTSDMLMHVIGLGEAEYLAALADPSRLQTRAAERAYRESFEYAFQHAELGYPREVYARALAPLAARWEKGAPPESGVVQHPAYGLGVVSRTSAREVMIAFEDGERVFAM